MNADYAFTFQGYRLDNKVEKNIHKSSLLELTDLYIYQYRTKNYIKKLNSI